MTCEIEYTTTDTALAAYLMSEGFEYSHLDNTNPYRCIFTYPNNSTQLSQLIHDYESGKAMGNIALFFHCYKRLLIRIKNHTAE